MKITNVVVSGLVESILASGFPMAKSFDELEFDRRKNLLQGYLSGAVFNKEVVEWCEKQMKRARTLASCEGGESHDCYLCGINVSFNVTAPRYWFPEEQRYHFADIVSSSSTMHCLKRNVDRMKSDPACIKEYFSPKSDIRVVNAVLEVAGEILDDTSISDNERIERLKAILPEGYLQTCRITTNYRQLKTWYRQRHNHRLSEWREMCEWILSLPLFRELIDKEFQGDEEYWKTQMKFDEIDRKAHEAWKKERMKNAGL